MTRPLIVLVAAALVATTAGAASAELQRLYVLDCGINQGKDQSRWSPGVNEGKPIEFSDNCYLIKHTKGLLLWDTGIPDGVAAMPDGVVSASGLITYRRVKTLAVQLAELGVKPADITYLALSHTHGDHVGNVALFPSSSVLIQGAEYEWAMAGPNKPAFTATQKIEKRPRRLRRRQRHDPLHAGPHARSPVAAGEAAEDRQPRALRRRRALPGQLGPQAGAVDEHQQGPDAGLAGAHRQGPRRAEGHAVDQSRQAAERHAEVRARVLRVRR